MVSPLDRLPVTRSVCSTEGGERAHRCAHVFHPAGLPMPTEVVHLDRLPRAVKVTQADLAARANTPPDSKMTSDRGRRLERVTRIELAFSAWEADVLPLNYTRVDSEIVSARRPARASDSRRTRMARARYRRRYGARHGCNEDLHPARPDRGRRRRRLDRDRRAPSRRPPTRRADPAHDLGSGGAGERAGPGAVPPAGGDRPRRRAARALPRGHAARDHPRGRAHLPRAERPGGRHPRRRDDRDGGRARHGEAPGRRHDRRARVARALRRERRASARS